jgi:glycosyltransferase involved in cell wall biosynthesis
MKGQDDKTDRCLAVVMPVYNEAATLPYIVHKVLQQQMVAELIVVDDCSADGSWEILEKLAKQDARVRLARHNRNFGKGMALKTGFSMVTAPIVIIQDADLEYDPLDYDRMIHPILSGRADVVYGSRFLGHGEHRVLYYWHAVGNRCLTTLCNMVTNLNLSDVETCYKAFRHEVLAKLEIVEERFGFEVEITAKLANLQLRVYEVPISYHGRTYAEGKKIGWRDGLHAIWCILKYGLGPSIGRGSRKGKSGALQMDL